MTSLRSAPDYEPSAFITHQHAFNDLPLQDWPDQLQAPSHYPPLQLVGREQPAETPQYRLGDPNLPVAPYREHFLQTVAANQSLVVSSETGSGKSSQLGLWLIEEGYPRVFVTQPRIVAARNLSEWARHNLGADHEYLAGHLTGNAADSNCHEAARLIYPTEELLYKMAIRGQLRPDDIVICDEAHERGVPTIMLLWEMKKLLRQYPDMRLIASSATIDTEMFSGYLGSTPDQPAPVLTFPGRTYPVERQESSLNVAAVMRRQMRDGKNVLAFERGVSSIATTAAKAQSRNYTHKVHSLYGDQSPKQQAAALDPSMNTHVVSSEVGGTSITPPNKQTVVDSGWSNYGGYEAGVRVLATKPTSKARLKQHEGRVGRTEPGLFVLAQPEDAPLHPPMDERPDYDPPAIENSSVATYLLELYAKNRRLELNELLERPTSENLDYDKRLLVRLGAVAIDGQGNPELTHIGDAMRHLPLDAPLARMVVEALQPADDAELDQGALTLQVAALAAILQVNGILNVRSTSQQRYLRRRSHEEVLSNETGSDVLFALDTFTWLMHKQQKLAASGKADHEEQFERLLVNTDILPNRYNKALRTFEELCRRLDLTAADLQKAVGAQRARLLACQITGAEELFVQRSKQIHHDKRGEKRTLGRRSTIAPNIARLVVGSAFDLRGVSKRGHYEKQFIAAGSVVTPEQLIAAIPHRITIRNLGCVVSRTGNLMQKQALYFDGEMEFAEREVDLPPTKETRAALITAMMTGRAPSTQDPTQMAAFHPGTSRAASAIARWKQAQELEQRSPVKLNVENRYKSLILKVINETLRDLPLDVTDMAILDDWIPVVYQNALVKPSRKSQVPEILRRSPDSVEVQCEDQTNMHIAVTYKGGVAYVTVPREVRFSMQRGSFANLEAHYDVKVRIGRGKYQHIDSAFDSIELLRPDEMAKRARRAALREMRATAASRREGEKTRRERRQQEELLMEVTIQAAIDRSLKIVRKGNHRNSRRVRRQLEGELSGGSTRKHKAAKRLGAAAL